VSRIPELRNAERPTLARVLGDDAAAARVDRHALETRAEYMDRPILLDALALDEALAHAAAAPPRAPLDPASVIGASDDAWPDARVAFDPAITFLALDYPLDDPATEPEPERVHVAVGREGITRLEAMAFELACLLRDGAPLGDACERIAATHGELDESELGPRLLAWFQEWSAAGWVVDVRFPVG
jgi:hypothetical protein